MFEKLGTRKPSGGFWEIDDVYKSIRFEEVEKSDRALDGTVMEMYLTFLFRSDILDVKLYEEIYDNGKVIQERWIEFPSTFRHQFGCMVARDMSATMDALYKENKTLTSESESMTGFIKRIHAEDLYKEYQCKGGKQCG